MDEQYAEYERQRAEYSAKVLDSPSAKKIVMAGPGTGKSFLFQQVAKKYRNQGKQKIIVLSFINELIRDLTIDMHGLAEVSTLHSFAAKQIVLVDNIFMRLLGLIASDYEYISGDKKMFDIMLHNLDGTDPEAIEFLRLRRGYYNSIDPSSMVYELVKFYEANPSKIPSYDLILVDEFQDFNLLEVELINLLSTKSHVLIAGDDDQSLYSFKHSVPNNIRSKHGGGEYTPFELPFCSRSTKVVIDSFHDVVTQAKSNGLLQSRIEKQYLYFPCEEKDATSAAYPHIVVRKNTQQAQNAYFIDSAIKELFEAHPKFNVMVVCSLRAQISKVVKHLKQKGYTNISGDTAHLEGNVLLAEGIALLLENNNSNLGWRLCAEALLDHQALKLIVKDSESMERPFKEYLSRDTRNLIRGLRAASAQLKSGNSLTDVQRKLIFEFLEIDPTAAAEEKARKLVTQKSPNKVHHNIPIKVTTILGSKGLSYDHVFLINFDDRYLCPNELDDEAVNKFLVALTRSKKQITIYTSQRSEPKLVSWIESNNKLVR